MNCMMRINGLMRIAGKKGCFNMIVNRNFAKFLSVIFACEFTALSGYVMNFFIPGFQSSGHTLFRFGFLILLFFVSVSYFSIISLESDISEKTGEDKGWFLIKGEIDYFILSLIVIVFGLFLIFMIGLILTILGII